MISLSRKGSWKLFLVVNFQSTRFITTVSGKVLIKHQEAAFLLTLVKVLDGLFELSKFGLST